jgi:hypothetical protein
MTGKMPPVPPESQSHKGTGDNKQISPDQPVPSKRARNQDEQGHQGNIKQNTTNQGYQQDR